MKYTLKRLSITKRWAMVAQSVATRAVKPGVVSSNPALSNIISTFDKSHCVTYGLTVYVEKQPVTWK